MAAKSRIGVIGCGAISGRQMKNLKTFAHVEVIACADTDMERAKARAQEFGIPRTCTVEEFIGSKEVDLLIDLTPPKAHYVVSAAAAGPMSRGWTAMCPEGLG